MQGKIERTKKVSRTKKTSDILPKEYEIVKIVVRGKEVVANIKEMMEIANCESHAEVIAAMNKCSSNYFYFARVETELEQQLVEAEEDYKLWLADKKSEFGGKEANSEAAKERLAIVEYKKEYEEHRKRISTLTSFTKQAKIAKSSLDKNISMIQSIGAMIRSQNPDPSPTSGF